MWWKNGWIGPAKKWNAMARHTNGAKRVQLVCPTTIQVWK